MDYDEANEHLDKLEYRIRDIANDLDKLGNTLSKTSRIILSAELQKITIDFADLSLKLEDYNEAIERMKDGA